MCDKMISPMLYFCYDDGRTKRRIDVSLDSDDLPIPLTLIGIAYTSPRNSWTQLEACLYSKRVHVRVRRPDRWSAIHMCASDVTLSQGREHGTECMKAEKAAYAPLTCASPWLSSPSRRI